MLITSLHIIFPSEKANAGKLLVTITLAKTTNIDNFLNIRWLGVNLIFQIVGKLHKMTL